MAWKTLVWAGAVGSAFAWSWVWFMGRGAAAVMFGVAVASVFLAWRGTQGNVRVALAGAMVAGLAMFLASVYWTAMMFLAADSAPVSAFEVVATGFFPMVTAVALLVGSAVGFRHVNDTTTATTTTTTSTSS
jgi:hypothetical protein